MTEKKATHWKSTVELEKHFEKFISIIGETPAKTFYQNWKIIGKRNEKLNSALASTLFTPETLIEQAKKGDEELASIRAVLSFMGYEVTDDIEKDLFKIRDSKEEVHFDSDLFCKHLFNSFDLDHSEFIDTNELTNMMEEMSLFDDIAKPEEKQVSKEEQVKLLFKEMDLKKNGKIDLSEFQQWWWNREKQN